MKNYKVQASTIKPRLFTLELSDEDVKRLYEKTAADGITPEVLLQGFISDLLDGTYAHGSDEVALAGQYYDRCGYDFFRSGCYLEWVLSNGRLDEMVEALELFNAAVGDIDYYAEHLDDSDGTPEFVQELMETKAEALNDLDAIYSDYAASAKVPEPRDMGMAAILEYIDDLESMMKG